MLRGDLWVRRPVSPVGRPGSRYVDCRLTAARRRRVRCIVVVGWWFNGLSMFLELGSLRLEVRLKL